MIYNVIGLMSGSSLDGLDIVFVNFQENSGKWTYKIECAGCLDYTQEWYNRLETAIHLVQNKATETVIGGALSAAIDPESEDPSNVYFGSWYRFKDALIPYIGLEFGGMRIGASYDINISSLKTGSQSRGGMEISLIYIKRPAGFKGLPCPKF